MLTAFAWLPLAQTLAIAPVHKKPELLASVPPIEGQALPRIPNELTLPQEVRPLPGQLDTTPVFNSNSPELIQAPGILLSTFPPENMADASAHLNYAFEGRFDFFAHHIARGTHDGDRRTLFIGGVVYNPNDYPVTLQVLQGVSYLSQEAPFRNLPELVYNPDGKVFAGPGSRVATEFLQGNNQAQWPRRVVIPPQQAYLLMNAPIPLRRLPFTADATLPPGSVLPGAPGTLARASLAAVNLEQNILNLPSNGRTVLLHLTSDGPVHASSLAMYAPLTLDGNERAPTLQEWLVLLVNGRLAGPRDIPPTDPEEYEKSGARDRFFYGRVAGVAQGSQWESMAVDEGTDTLQLPDPGDSLSYVLSTVDYNTFGTQQIQSSPMLVRYPDTAYRAHGNYGVRYQITLPLWNNSEEDRRVVLKLQTPLQDETLETGLRFLRNPQNRIFFRGTVRIRYETPAGQEEVRHVHVVQRQGQEGEPLLRLNIPPQAKQTVVVDFIYPPDATPPQVLTIATLDAFKPGAAETEPLQPSELPPPPRMDEQPEDEQQLEPDIEDSLIDANLDLPPAPATEAELEADTSEVPPASVRMGEVIGIQE
jgi:hypothetical protein